MNNWIKSLRHWVGPFAGLLLSCSSAWAQPEKQIGQHDAVRIAVLVPFEHPAMNDLVQGFQQRLKAIHPHPERLVWTVRNAKGDVGIQKAIVKSLSKQHWDLWVPISTATAQALVRNSEYHPVLLMAGTLSTETVQHCLTQKRVCLALVDDIPTKPSIDLIRYLLPELKRMTLIYSPEPHLLKQAKQLDGLLKQDGVSLSLVPIRQLADFRSLAKRLDSKAQALFVLKDNFVVDHIAWLIQASLRQGIPLMTMDNGSVQAGATLALAVPEFIVGQQAADLAMKILAKDKSARSMNIASQLAIFVHKKHLLKQAFSLRYLEKVAARMMYPLIVYDHTPAHDK